MKRTNKNRKSKFLALLLSAMMLSSTGAVLASCANGGESSSSSSSTESSSTDSTTSTKKDEGLVKNSNFNFTTLSNTTVIGTPSSWNASSSGAATHSKTSGVIDVSEEGWKYLTKHAEDVNLNDYKTATEIPEDVWDKLTAKDKLDFYTLWKKENSGKTISKDFKNYESLNVSATDKLPDETVENPGRHEGFVDADAENKDYNVLMIHNSTKSDKIVGTAKKYTSSSTVSIPAGSSAEISVWVKTANLMMSDSQGNAVPAIGKGAYISVSNTVGGKALDAYEVKNIQADEWTKYSFYIQGSSYATTTFAITLGLGQGSGDDQYEYVQGFAFFDDIQCEIITNDEYATATTGINNVADINDEKAYKTVDAFTSTQKTFAMDFNTQTWEDDFVDSLMGSFTSQKTEASDGINTNEKLDTTNDEIGAFDNFAAIAAADANNAYLQSVYNNFLNKTEYAEKNGVAFNDKDTLLILSTGGAAYTVDSSYKFSVPANESYVALSFYVKTSDLDGGIGAGISLFETYDNNENVLASFSSIDTSDLTGVTIGDDEDAYDGWQQVFFFVERPEDSDINSAFEFQLRFNYGPTDITSATAKTSFKQGFAAFTNFETLIMNEIEFDSAATGTYAKKVTLLGEDTKETTGNSGFDSAAAVPSDALENGLANLQNYKGVYSDSAYVMANSTNRDVNGYANAGLLNKESFEKAFAASAGKAWRDGIANGETNATTVWNNVFEDSTQPLLIWNANDATKAYGFISSSKSLATGYTAVSVRVKTVDAKASVYVVDMNDENRSVLSVNKSLSYWYDENGNICDGDPSKSATLIAFKLGSNGLYTANDNWNGYTADMNGKYYANLSAYSKNANGDLVAADNSATHDYHGYDWDRIVFYKGTDGYYTEANNGGVKVHDLLDLTKKCDYEDVETYTGSEPLSCRYYPWDGEGNLISRKLQLENIETNGEWMTVTFYIGKGDNAKNYRLEVWSGTRNSSTVNTTGYVIFDTNNPGTASTNVDSLLTMHKNNDYADVDMFESVFSYYDTDKHVRYDKAADTEKVGNLYTAPTKEAGVAYLCSETSTSYTVIADYSKSDVNVAATTPETEEEDTTEEDTNDSETNVWLLASSISVAAVLLLAVLSIVIRKVVEKTHKKHGFKVRKPKTKKETAVKKVEKKVDEDSPYND